MNDPASPREEVEIREPLDVFQARARVTALATDVGFSSVESQELAIVVSEMATNILKYGIRGHIRLEVVEDAAAGVGISIVARDVGPPFRDLSIALRDGCDGSGP